MADSIPSSILDHFADITDPRMLGKTDHKLIEVIMNIFFKLFSQSSLRTQSFEKT